VDLSIFRHKLKWESSEGEWVVGDGSYCDGNQFVIPKRTGPQWLQEMMVMATAQHETINLGIWGVFVLIKLRGVQVRVSVSCKGVDTSRATSPREMMCVCLSVCPVTFLHG
jgi:hypothetical protein